MKSKLAVCVTGAGGAVYAKKFIEFIDGKFDEIALVVSRTGEVVLREELGISPEGLVPASAKSKYVFYDRDDMTAPIASGSHDFYGVVVIPCTMGTLGRVASGVSDNLITRCCDVCLKERRPAVFVTRETPLSLIHLRNMTTVTEAGGIVLPACPAFYNGEKTLDEAVSFVADRVVRVLGLSGVVGGWKNNE